jgi:hypothetical protein
MAPKALPSAKINPTKLLGGSSFSTKKISVGSLRNESITIPKRDLIVIKTQVIKIRDLIQSSTLLKSAEIERKRKESEKEKFGKEEEKLETKKEPGDKKLNVPGLPKLGFLDRLKNFIFNTLLGYFVYRLVPYIPQLVNFVKIAAPAFDFIIDMSGKLLNGMVSFIDAGYKAVDATRGLVGKTFGDDALKNFDKLTGEFEKFMNLAIIVGMASADFGMDRLGRKLSGKGAEKGAEKGAGTLGRRGAGRVAARTGARVAGKSGAKLAGKIGSKALKAIPLLGAGLAIAEGIMRIKDGDYVGGLLSFGSAIPVAGWAFLALDIAREFMGGQEFDKSVGRSFGGKPGLTDKQVQKKTPHMSGPSFMGFAGGGSPTRGGKFTGNVKRQVKKTKVSRQIATTPTKLKPGSTVGGKEKIKNMFPEPDQKNKNKQVNPLGYIENTYNNDSKIPFFGPILAIAIKRLVGDKPSSLDYKNAGMSLNSWMNNTFSSDAMRSGAFAGGGEVNSKMFMKGEDLSNVIAKSLEESISSKVDDALNDLRRQLMLKGAEPEKPSGSGAGPGEGNDDGGGGIELQGNLASKSVQLSKRLQQMFGLKDFQAAAIVGTWLREGFGSGFSDVIQGPGGGTRGAPTYNAPSTKGYGMAQWTNVSGGGPNDRLNRAMIFLGMKDNPRPWTVDDTLKVLKWEVETKGYGRAISDLKKTTNMEDAVRVFVGNYEAGSIANIASFPANTIPDRVASAKGVLKYMTSGKDDQGKALETAKITPGLGKTGPGDGSFIQGNSGRSDGVHFHVGTNKPGDASGSTAASFNTIKHFLGKKSVFIGRSEETIPAGATDDEIMGYIRRGQKAHGRGGTELDIQVGGAYGQGNKVAFPLGLKNMTYSSTNGYGTSADIVGTNAFVGHGRYKSDGSLAAQQRTVLSSGAPDKYYGFGGLVRKRTRAVLGERGPEFVIDADSTAALEDTFPGFLAAVNKANYGGAIEVLRNYASYEFGAEEQIVVQQLEPEIVYLPMPMSMGKGMGFGGGDSSPDSDYDMTYMNA